MAVGLKKRRRIQMVVAGAVLLAAATGIVGYAMRNGIEFFGLSDRARVSSTTC